MTIRRCSVCQKIKTIHLTLLNRNDEIASQLCRKCKIKALEEVE